MGIKSSLKIPIKCVILRDEGILPIRNLEVHILRDITNMSLSATYREKEMATHSSVLAWRIPGAGEPGGLPSMGSYRVGHDWSDLAAAAATYKHE